MEYCEVCGRNQVEHHHIVSRRQAIYMTNIKLNIKTLCIEHHKGSKGAHGNRAVDLKYKLELQEKLILLFDKDFYSEKEIKEKLETNLIEVRKITKKMMLYKEGYEKEELIRRLMGGRIYEN